MHLRGEIGDGESVRRDGQGQHRVDRVAHARRFRSIPPTRVGPICDATGSRSAASPTAAEQLATLPAGLTPEMVAAVSKLMRAADLISVAKAARVTTAFRPRRPGSAWPMPTATASPTSTLPAASAIGRRPR
jgi:hypothetical protein